MAHHPKELLYLLYSYQIPNHHFDNENNNYTSVSDGLISEFPYAYAVKAKEVEEIPVTPEEDITNTNNTVEEVENPETSDGVLIFLSLTVIGFAGTALAFRRLHN